MKKNIFDGISYFWLRIGWNLELVTRFNQAAGNRKFGKGFFLEGYFFHQFALNKEYIEKYISAVREIDYKLSVENTHDNWTE